MNLSDVVKVPVPSKVKFHHQLFFIGTTSINVRLIEQNGCKSKGKSVMKVKIILLVNVRQYSELAAVYHFSWHDNQHSFAGGSTLPVQQDE